MSTAIRHRWRQALDAFSTSCWVPDVVLGDRSEMGSRYFGQPWIPDGEAWPSVDGNPLGFVLQLDVATLPSAVSSLLGGKGLVQLFYDERGDLRLPSGGDTSKRAIARVVRPDLVSGARRLGPYEIGQTLTIVDWGEQTDYPCSHDYPHLSDSVLADLDRVADQLALDGDERIQQVGEQCLQGDKLGGWPFWFRGNMLDVPSVNGEPMVPFYQVDAGLSFEGPSAPAHAPALFEAEGTGHLFVLPSDPSRLLFRCGCA